MNTKNSPFNNNTFQNIWVKHFIPKTKTQSFKFIEGIECYKNKWLAVYFNVGKNLTKGISYILNNNEDFKNKTLIIYDVLPHLMGENEIPKNIGVLKSFQYSGYLIHTEGFKTIDDYLLNTFSKNTRMKMRKFSNRLESCFNISYKMFLGNIDKAEYNDLFDDFMTLLQKRYSDKQITYNNMQPDEWGFYKDVAYPLILEKKASLFVIYDNNKPIAITYNYHTPDTVIDAITVFDIDYSKFNLGYVNNLKLLNWCFENNIKTLDFSKGYFDYKKRMCTLEYDFEYHIIYDKRSLISKIKAHLFHIYFQFKASLRNKGINSKFHKLTYGIKHGKKSNTTKIIRTSNLDKLPSLAELTAIDIKEESNYYVLKKHVNDFLYLVVKPYQEIDIYKSKNEKNVYILSYKSAIQQIKIEST